MVSTVLENGLAGELDAELGYSKYDYRHKETDNSRNGYSEKTLKSSVGDIELQIPRDRKGEFEPQLVKNRGVNDILIACVDGLTGFPNAIEAVFPQTEIQQCIIHQIRNTTRFVSYKDIKPLMSDLKRVYQAVDEQSALHELDSFDEKWSGRYPKIAVSWRANWANLATFFKYPQEVRTLIYTTNAIENFNRGLRKVTKSKSVFPTDDALLKMLYLAMVDITKKWTGRRRDWGQIHSQLEIFFADRLDILDF
jgi:transposase-like protein